MTIDLTGVPVLVAGAGAMGVGSAQVAAQAGHTVFLYDVRAGAAASAKTELVATSDKLAGKGKLTPPAATACAERVVAAEALSDAGAARLYRDKRYRASPALRHRAWATSPRRSST